MAKSTLEILIGTGTMYLAPDGTAFPADPSVTPAGTWVDVGYSEEGWELTVSRTTEAIPVAELLDPVDVIATGREAHVIGNAVQSSLENFKTALGGGTITTAVGPPATKTFVPSSTDTIVPQALLFRHKAPTVGTTAKVRDVQVPHVLSIGSVTLAGRKAPTKTAFAMDFRLKQVTGDNFFAIVDLT